MTSSLKESMLIRKILIDITCFATVSFWALYFQFFNTPYQRGFFCNDDSINYPAKQSTVSTLVLAVIGNVLPISTVLIGEYLFAKKSKKKSSQKLFRWLVPLWVSMAYKKIGMFLFGMVSIALTTDIAKHTIGRLRPNFMKLCEPSIDCSLLENQNRYIDVFECTNHLASPQELTDLRLSFPSGHAAISFYVSIYLILYLHLRIRWKGSELLKYFLEAICLWLAWYTSMSRISDYKHHWSDVLVGIFIGIAGALIIVFYAADFFNKGEIIRVVGTSDEEMMISRTQNIITSPIFLNEQGRRVPPIWESPKLPDDQSTRF